MDKRAILVQLDSDPVPSLFDRIVAVDGGAELVFSHGGVRTEQVRGIVQGAIFTRGPKDLKRTALFIGGSDLAAGEALLAEAVRHMLPAFGLRVSVLLDASGANTTAAAVVFAAAQHLELKGARALVLGAGPVGQHITRLLARQGAEVRIGERDRARAEAACNRIRALIPAARLEAVVTGTADEVRSALADRQLLVSAGSPGALLVPRAARASGRELRVAIDVNAVPPLGIEGVSVTDRAVEHDGATCYGAIGVGDLKMKLHKAAIARLFERNDQVLDVEELYALAGELSGRGLLS
jgi:hypothetical protein